MRSAVDDVELRFDHVQVVGIAADRHPSDAAGEEDDGRVDHV